MKKCISFLLILALMLTMIPVSVFAAEETTEFITIEVSVDTTVREKASQDAKVLSKVKRGGYLISTGSVTNRWGNVWFRVVDPTTGEEGFIYSGKVHEHQCDYRDVDGCDALEFCSCGNIRKVASGMMHTNVYALPAQVLDPDVVAAICASGAAIGSAATAVFPYVVVVVAFGVLVYMSVKVADNSVTIDKVSTDWRRLDADFKPNEGLYYNGMIKDGFFYIDVSQPMDVNEAIDVVECTIGDTLNLYLREGKRLVYELLGNSEHLRTLFAIINDAISLVDNNEDDVENIIKLGSGWDAHECLAIALYCCLRYPMNFKMAVLAAANHPGNTAATACLTGQIMGAKLGYSRIDPSWINALEQHAVILEIADDLTDECQLHRYGAYDDPKWRSKYQHCDFTM